MAGAAYRLRARRRLHCRSFVVNGALAVYGHHLCWVHLLLILVVPALLVWAQPIRLLHDAGGPVIGAQIDQLRRGRPLRTLVSPRVTVPLYAAALVLTQPDRFSEGDEPACLDPQRRTGHLRRGALPAAPPPGRPRTDQ